MLNIACVLKVQESKKGVIYSEEWVEKLFHQISRHLHTPFNFTCLSNVSTKFNTIPLITESHSFWNKIELFRPNLFTGPVLYFDLDVLICKDITKVVNNFQSLNKFLMVKEPYQDIVNSSIMYWSGDYSYLYNNYVNNKDLLCEEYKKVPRYGDQSYISENVEYDLIENYAPINFINWKHHKIETPINDPSILIFTSRHQKPSNNLELDIVRTNWR
jgi:hypothetical protein